MMVFSVSRKENKSNEIKSCCFHMRFEREKDKFRYKDKTDEKLIFFFLVCMQIIDHYIA